MSKLAAFGRGRSLGAKISGGRGHPWGIFFGFYKTRHILLSDGANCTMLRAVVLTQYRHVTETDRWTDRRTELPTRALRRAVKITRKELNREYDVSQKKQSGLLSPEAGRASTVGRMCETGRF